MYNFKKMGGGEGVKKFHLRILTVIILTMTISTFACTSYAGDIPSDWAKDDIASAIELNIIKADDFTDFNENINREKFCEIIVNLYEILSSSNNGEELDTIVKGYGA
ncbi:MAG: hypothetical protein RSA27_05165, partial [Oscillospiraceae bacterium]